MGRWLQDRRGAIVGDVLAKRLRVKSGRQDHLRGNLRRLEFNIDGVYQATQKSIRQVNLVLPLELPERIAARPPQRSNGWITSRVSNVAQSANVTAAIDKSSTRKTSRHRL